MDLPLSASNVEPTADRIAFDLDRDGIVRGLAGAVPARLADAIAVGGGVLDHIHPSEREFVAATLRWIVDEPDREGNIAFRFARGNGSWLNVTAALRGDGATVRVTAAVDDVALARRAEAQMRRVVEASRQGIVVRTADELLYLNDAFAQLLGYDSKREVYALGEAAMADTVHADDRQLVVDRIRARMAGKEAVSHYEIRLMRKNGAPLWVAVAAGSIVWDGKPASLSWLTDIDERKRAEAALIESKEAAEFANRSKTDFLAHMSHELRTPLNAVLGFSEMIAHEQFGPIGSPKYVEYAGDIHRSGSLLLDLINDILDLSKIEAGKLELRETDVSLNDLVAECVLLLRNRAGDAKVALQVELPARLLGLRADERAIKQVLLNLLSNAVKFTPAGGTVTVRAEDKGGRGLDLSVTDTGIGMSPAEIAVAFSPFGQIDSEIARRHVGTGLGLPLSRSLIRLHGGDIGIASERGRGTIVTACFPNDRVIQAAA
jgi:PAS domain S-box-containing protein